MITGTINQNNYMTMTLLQNYNKEIICAGSWKGIFEREQDQVLRGWR